MDMLDCLLQHDVFVRGERQAPVAHAVEVDDDLG